jgi:hypothetical protein
LVPDYLSELFVPLATKGGTSKACEDGGSVEPHSVDSRRLLQIFGQIIHLWSYYPSLVILSIFGHIIHLWSYYPSLVILSIFGHIIHLGSYYPSWVILSILGHIIHLGSYYPSWVILSILGHIIHLIHLIVLESKYFYHCTYISSWAQYFILTCKTFYWCSKLPNKSSCPGSKLPQI